MTSEHDNMNQMDDSSPEELTQAISVQEELDEDFDDQEDFDAEESNFAEGELTPNDIFGLDPLDVLTLEELADYLKISPAAARRAVKEQNLPGRNIGGEWRFLRDSVANWLRGQEGPAQKQQQEREQYSRSSQRPYSAEQSGGGGGEYRPRQRFSEGGSQYGGYGTGQGGQSSQYGSRGGQYGGNQGGNQGGSTGYNRPPRRPFRSTEGNEQSGYGGGSQGGDYGGGYSGGYSGGAQRFRGGAKRKNKRQVSENERGKRLDRRKEGEGYEGRD